MKKTNINMFLTNCLVLAGLFFIIANITEAKTIQLKYAGLLPPGVALSAPVDEWGKLVEERTNGQVKLTTYHGQALGKFQEFPKMLHSGMCEMAFVGPPTPGFDLLGAFELPLDRTSQRIRLDVIRAVYAKGLLSLIFEEKGYKPILFMNGTPRYIFTRDKRITRIDQIKGLKLRGTTPIHIEVAKALGATAVFISPADVYMALERGTVDGAVNSVVGTLAAKLEESLKYCLWEQVTADVGVAVMSLKVWNSLPADIRLVMQDVNEVMQYRYLDYYNSETDYAVMTKEKGIEIDYLNPDEKALLDEMLSPIAKDWVRKMEAKGLPARAIAEEIFRISVQY